jgi:hypothetical protein
MAVRKKTLSKQLYLFNQVYPHIPFDVELLANSIFKWFRANFEFFSRDKSRVLWNSVFCCSQDSRSLTHVWKVHYYNLTKNVDWLIGIKNAYMAGTMKLIPIAMISTWDQVDPIFPVRYRGWSPPAPPPKKNRPSRPRPPI